MKKSDLVVGQHYKVKEDGFSRFQRAEYRGHLTETRQRPALGGGTATYKETKHVFRPVNEADGRGLGEIREQHPDLVLAAEEAIALRDAYNTKAKAIDEQARADWYDMAKRDEYRHNPKYEGNQYNLIRERKAEHPELPAEQEALREATALFDEMADELRVDLPMDAIATGKIKFIRIETARGCERTWTDELEGRDADKRAKAAHRVACMEWVVERNKLIERVNAVLPPELHTELIDTTKGTPEQQKSRFRWAWGLSWGGKGDSMLKFIFRDPNWEEAT